MQLLTADYVLVGIAAVMAITGLFRGFSGTIAFFAAVAALAISAAFGWKYSTEFVDATWARALATLVVALLAFGIVRMIVRKLVNGLLAQPSDALFGFLLGALFGALVVIGWAASGMYLEYSNLATEAAKFLR